MQLTKNFPVLFAGLSVFLTGTGAGAETRLESLTIEAARTGQSIAELPKTTQVIDEAQLEKQLRSGANLSEALGKLVPGLGPSSQTLTNFTQTLRGRDPLYLIDGVSLNSARAISRQLNALHPDQIERVEVISGATAIYGAGGSGGIINIVTKDAGPEGLTMTTRAGINVFTADLKDGDQYRFSQSLSWRDGPFSLRISGTAEARNGFFDGDGERISPDAAQISRHDTDTLDLHLKAGLALPRQRMLSFTLQDFEDEQDSDYAANFGGPGLPALFGASVEAVAVEGLRLDDQPLTDRRLAHLDYHDPEWFGQDVRTQFYWREEKFRFFPFPGLLPAIPALGIPATPYVNQSTNTAEIYGLRTTFTTPLEGLLGSQGRLVWGFDYDRDDNEATATQYDLNTYAASGGLVHDPLGTAFDYSPDVETTSRAVFAQLDWPVTEQVTVQGGIRYQDIAAEVADYIPITESIFQLLGVQPDPAILRGGTLDYDATVFNLGLVYRLGPTQELFAGFSQGFEQPDIARLLRSAQPPGSLPVATGVTQPASVNDSSLDAIETDAFEIGWRGHFSDTEALLAVYYNESDKTAVFDGRFAGMLEQQQRVYGVEGSLTRYEGAFLSWGASFGWQKGETQNTDGSWDALTAWDVSPPKGRWFVAWDGPEHDLLLQVTHIADYDEATNDGVANAVDIDGYTTVDFSASAKLGPGRIGFAVDNLLDEDYVSVYAQQAGGIYGSFTRISAFGRRVGITYQVTY